MKLIDIINPKKYYSDGYDESTELRMFTYWKYTGEFHLLLEHIGLPISIYGNVKKTPYILILLPKFYIKFGEQSWGSKFVWGNSPHGIYFYRKNA